MKDVYTALLRVAEYGFRYGQPTKLVPNNSITHKALLRVMDDKNSVSDTMFGIPVKRFVTPHGELLFTANEGDETRLAELLHKHNHGLQASHYLFDERGCDDLNALRNALTE